MAEFYVNGQHNNISRVADGTATRLRSTRDGAIFTAPWIQALVLEGRVFYAEDGNFTTPTAGHAGIDADQPELDVDIPDGTVGIPLDVWVATEATGGTGLETLAIVSPTLVGAGTSTAVTPVNLRLDNPVAVAATARRTYSANGTDPTASSIELFRVQVAVDMDTADFVPGNWGRWNAQQLGPAPLIADGGSIVVYRGATTSTTGFGRATWAELAESAIL